MGDDNITWEALNGVSMVPTGKKRRSGRPHTPGQPKRVRAELEKALKANDYRRVEALARVANALERNGR